MVVSATATAARPDRIDSLAKSMLAFCVLGRKRLWYIVVSDVGVNSKCRFAVMMKMKDKLT